MECANTVCSCNTPAELFDALAEALQGYDVMDEVVVAVPTVSTGALLKMRLTQRDGICAGISFVTLDGLCNQLRRESQGDFGLGRDPWSKEELTLRILGIVSDLRNEPLFEHLTSWLALEYEDEERLYDKRTKKSADLVARRNRRLPWARRVAGLFLDYAAKKPEMLVDWASQNEKADKCLGLHAWQPILWRALVDDAREDGLDPAAFALSESLSEDLDCIAPTAVHLYGFAVVPEGQRKVLDALGDKVTTWSLSGAFGGGFLKSWDAQRDTPVESEVDLPEVRIHGCIGASRQIEVLQDLVVDAIDPEHGGLNPSDIAVLVPCYDDLEALVSTSFGTGLGAEGKKTAGNLHPSHVIPTWMSKQSRTSPNDPFGVLLCFLDLIEERFSRSSVLKLFGLPPVSRHLGLKPSDMSNIRQLVDKANICWGWSVEDFDRKQILEDDEAGTWLPAVSHLPEDFAKALNDIASLVGHICGGDPGIRLFSAYTHTLTQWGAFLREALDLLCESELKNGSFPYCCEWIDTRLVRRSDLSNVSLSLSEVRSLLSDRGGRPYLPHSAARGSMIVCHPRDVSCIPFERVILLGVSDRSLTGPPPDGDDVLVNDRESLLLDDDKSVRQRMYLELLGASVIDVLYDRRSEHTGMSLDTPAVVAELSASFQAKRSFHGLHSFLSTGSGDAYTYDPLGKAAFKAIEVSHDDPCLADKFPCSSIELNNEIEVDVRDLMAFVRNPPLYFLKSKFGISQSIDSLDDKDLFITRGLNELERYELLNRLLLGPGIDGRKSAKKVAFGYVRGRGPVPKALAESIAESIVNEIWTETGVPKIGDADKTVWDTLRAEANEFNVTYYSKKHKVKLKGTLELHDNCFAKVVDGNPDDLNSVKKMLEVFVPLLAIAASHDCPKETKGYLIGLNGSKVSLGEVFASRPAAKALDKFIGLYRLGVEAPLPVDPSLAYDLLYATFRDSVPFETAKPHYPKDGYRRVREPYREYDSLIWGPGFDWEKVTYRWAGNRNTANYIRLAETFWNDCALANSEGRKR